MKKTIILLIIFLAFTNGVKAETYYGEYKQVDMIDNYSSDMIKIERIKLYNTYKTNYIDMGYMEENNDYLLDKNDYKEEYIEISQEEIGDEYINISTNVLKESNFVISGLTNNMKIYEIEIFLNEEKVDLGVLTAHYKYVRKVIDKDYDTYLSGEELERIFLFAYKTSNIESFKINIYTKDNEDYNLNIIIDRTIIPFTLNNKNKNKHIIDFTYQNKEGYNVTYKYKGIKKLFRHYKEEKEILNNYVEHGENIVLDDFIDIENFYQRDKLTLNDNIIINNKEQKLDDFIEYASSDVNINCNIDYNLNGKYTCEFLLNDILVKKDVTLDIPKGEETTIEIINNDSNYSYKYKEYSDIEISNNEEYNIISNNEEYNTISNKESTTKKLIIKKENNLINKSRINRIKYIIILNLIIIEIILFIKKKKK